jgi:hypothetical protein
LPSFLSGCIAATCVLLCQSASLAVDSVVEQPNGDKHIALDAGSAAATGPLPDSSMAKPSAGSAAPTLVVTPEDQKLIEIENVTNDIVRTEIDLMRFSTQLHATWVKPSRWKSWRVFGYKIAGSGCINAGMICIASSRFKYMNNPATASRPFLKSGHIINMTGASVIVAGTLFESVLDRIAEKRHAKEHLDLKSARKRFIEMEALLSGLLDKRSALVSACPSLTASQKAILDSDGLVLQDLRDLAVTEFQYSYTDIARLRTARDVASALTVFGAATAEYGGSLQSLLSVANRQPKQTGAAGIGFMTSGASVIASPLLINLSERFARSRAQKDLQLSGLNAQKIAVDKFDEHRKQLEQLIARADSSDTQLLKALDARKSVYQAHGELFDSREESRASIEARAKKELAERMFFSTIVGGTQVARGAQLAVAGFKYYDQPTKSFPVVAASATTFIAGSGVWTLDNIQGKVREEVAKKRATRTSVHAKLLEDLDDLEDMDDQMSIF